VASFWQGEVMIPEGAQSDPRWRSPTALYRYFTPERCLLYVGISNRPDERHRTHAMRAEWFKYASCRSVEWFPTRALAEWAEDAVIAAEDPDFNRKRFSPGPFARKSDKWFLGLNGNKPKGQHLSWHRRPTAALWRGDFEPCEEPAWVEP
jgi:hypothetical protein